MKTIKFVLVTVLIFAFAFVQAQSELKYLRKGNSAYNKGDYNDAEILYRRALEENPNSLKALYNLGNALYRQNNFEEAAKIINSITDAETSKKIQSKLFHNLGNAHFKNEAYAESVEAYKNALRLNPKDHDTKYNLSYALSKLQQQENQQCENNQDNEKDEEQEQQEQEQQEQEQQQEEQQQQESKDEISKEDAERILDALEKQEQNVQDKVNKQQVRPTQIIIEKDW